LVIAFITWILTIKSEEADPLHGINDTRRYPIGKGSNRVNSWPVDAALFGSKAGEAGQIQGARSKAGRVKAWPVTLGPWINGGGAGKDRRREARP